MGRSFVFPLLIFLLTPFLLFAEGATPEKERALEGISLECRLFADGYSETADEKFTAFEGDFTFMPTLHYRTEGAMEITPYLLVRYEMERDESHIQDSNPQIYTELNRLSLGAGSGFYWTFMETKCIDVLSGFRTELVLILPQWGDSAPTGYYNFDPGVGGVAGTLDIPLGFEVNPFGRFRIRLWTEVLRLGVRWDEEYYRDDIIDRTLTFFSYSPFWTPGWTPDSNDDWAAYPTPISFSLIWGL